MSRKEREKYVLKSQEKMRIIIEAEAKEIAALVLLLQEQHDKSSKFVESVGVGNLKPVTIQHGGVTALRYE